MKRSLLAVFAALICSLSVSAPAEAKKLTRLESGRVGNGGFAYVCRGADSKIVYARLLDLWEAEGIPTWSKNDAVDAQIAAALNRLKEFSSNAWVSVSEYIEKFQKRAIFSNRSLNPTEDAFPPYRPEPGCGYEQVARYEPLITETGLSGVRISAEIFNSPFFSNSDRAALFFHEAAYFVDRERNKATNSRLTRMVVAHIFSDTIVPNTVRLAAAALLSGKTRLKNIRSRSEEWVPATIVAVPDLSKMRFTIQFDRVDGIDRNNLDAIKPAQASSKYRCQVMAGSTTEGKGVLHFTKWVSLKELVETYVYSTAPEAVRITGEFRALEAMSPREYEVRNSMYLACEKRSAQGVYTPVKFQGAILKLPEGNSLYIAKDDSLSISDGLTPLSPSIDSGNELIRAPGVRPQYIGEFVVELVRGVF